MFFTAVRNGVRLPQVGLGVHIDGDATGYVSAPPALGEHSREVLAHDLGLEPARVEELARRQRIKIAP